MFLSKPDLASLEKTIDKAFEERDGISTSTRGEVREAIETALDLLDKGEVRVRSGLRAVIVTYGPLPPVFQWLQQTGNVETSEMRRVFNMGIGLTLVVSPYYASSVLARLSDSGIACFEIGEIIPGTGKVIITP